MDTPPRPDRSPTSSDDPDTTVLHTEYFYFGKDLNAPTELMNSKEESKIKLCVSGADART